MKSNKISHLLIIGFLAILFSGCSEETSKQFMDTFKIKNELVKQYNHKNISINTKENSSMTINFIDSSFNWFGKNEGEKKAREIALFCESLLGKTSKIQTITITFTIQEKTLFFVSSRDTVDTYTFNTSELKRDLEIKKIQQSIFNYIPMFRIY